MSENAQKGKRGWAKLMDVYQTAPEKDHSRQGETVGDMQKRRETMADGRRYLIYYTFEPVSTACVSGRVADEQENPPAHAGGTDIMKEGEKNV